MKNILSKIIFFAFLSVSFLVAQTKVELISNNTFESGLSGWNLLDAEPTRATVNLDTNNVITGKNSVHVNLLNPQKAYPSGKIALYTTLDIEEGVEYTISLKIRSSKALQGNAIWWSMYDSLSSGVFTSYYNSMWGNIKLDADTTVTYETTFTANFTDPTADFSLDLAAITSDSVDIWVDDVSFSKMVPDPEELPLPKGTELISNTDFKTGLDGWSLFTDADNLATLDLDTENVIRGMNSAHVDLVKPYKGYPSGKIALFTGVSIKKDKEYYIRLTLRADKPIKQNGIWWTLYDSLAAGVYSSYYNGMWGQVTVDADSNTIFEANFTANFTDPTADFSLDLAAIKTDSINIWFDDVHLIEIDTDPEEEPLPKGKELISNTDLKGGLSGWSLFTDADGLATYALDTDNIIRGDNSIRVDLEAPYKEYPSGKIALFTGVDIKQDKEYYIRLTLRADKPIKENGIWWTLYDSLAAGVYSSYYNGMWGQITVDADSNTIFEANFTANFTDPTADFSLDLAAIKTDSIKIWFDDIHLIELEPETPVDTSKSLAFNLGDGRDEYLVTRDTVNNFGLTANFTMEGWFNFENFDASGGEDHLMRLGAQLFVDSENHLKVQADSYVAGTTTLETGVWYHIAYVRTATEVTVYLNGETEIVASGADAGTAERFLIGSYGEPNTSYNFAGKIDEIRLWSVARTQTEVSEKMGEELTGTEDSLLIYYDFNGGSGDVVVDRAGGDNNGMLFNMEETNWSTDTPFAGSSINEPKLPEGTELLSNNYFNNGLDKWSKYLKDRETATLVLDEASMIEGEKSAHVHVRRTYSADDSWKIQLRQMEVKDGLKANNKYHIQFMVKANKAITGMKWALQELHGSFSTIYSREVSVPVNELLIVADTLECMVTDTLVQWSFDLGGLSEDSVDIWFDAVHLIDLDEQVGVEKEDALPTHFSLEQNYPNPFNPSTVISFTLPKASDVKLAVYNILGEKVTTLLSSKMVAGNHSVNFNASNLASGIYIYRITAGNFVSVKKMMLLK